MREEEERREQAVRVGPVGQGGQGLSVGEGRCGV